MALAYPKVEGSYTFYFDRQTVWDILMNPQAVAEALPGVQMMQPLKDELFAWHTVAQLEFGSRRLNYSGVIRMTEIRSLEQYRLHVLSDGQGMKVEGTMLVRLHDHEEAERTIITWQAEASFGDDVSEMMHGLFQMASMLLAQQFFMGLAKQLRAQRA